MPTGDSVQSDRAGNPRPAIALSVPCLSPDTVRGFLEAMRDQAPLDDHPARSALAGVLLSPPDSRSGECAARALHAFWRARFRPVATSLLARRAWNTWLILEVMYFYPYTQGRRGPGTLRETAASLCDVDHLARVIAGGHDGEARSLLRNHAGFLAGLVPPDMAPSVQTVHSRRDAALARLTRALFPASAHASDQPPGPPAETTAMPAPSPIALPAEPALAPGAPRSRLEEIWWSSYASAPQARTVEA